MYRIYFVPASSRILHRARDLAPCVRVWFMCQCSTEPPWLHRGVSLRRVYAQRTASAHAPMLTHYLINACFCRQLSTSDDVFFTHGRSGVRATLKQVEIYVRGEACYSILEELHGAPTSFFIISTGAAADCIKHLTYIYASSWSSRRMAKVRDYQRTWFTKGRLYPDLVTRHCR